MRCTYCGSILHTYRNCPKTYSGSAQRALMRCSYCGGRDHEVPACPHTFAGSAARRTHPHLVADHFVKDKP